LHEGSHRSSIADVPDPTSVLMLRAGDAAVAVHPASGGRLGQITVAAQPLLIDVPDEGAHPTQWGSFPMAPWAGRVRQGRFHFDGHEHRLAINHHDGDGPARAHAIHGVVFDRRWRVVDESATACSLQIDLDWEFGGRAVQNVELAGDRLSVTLTVAATDRPFPATIGWHPWFLPPDRLEFRPTAMYRRDDVGIPTGELVTPGPRPWDDCFLNTEPVELHYERAVAPRVRVESDCDHWVVFDEMVHSTCVEPQSGPPDAFNLSPRPPVDVVTPDTPLTRTMTISW
jgi:aldose 1-epimerase